MAFSRKKQLSPAVAALAPDLGTATRAAGLATTRKWRDLAGNPEVVWGECRSSGTAYYRVVVDLTQQPPRPNCNCPVRSKFCKHNLALIELFREQSDAFQITDEAPEWVLSFLEQLHAGQQKSYAPRTEAEEAELANQRRAARRKRLDAMRAGIVQLEDWLLDLMRNGVANLVGQSPAYWTELGARMTDAQLGGIGNRVRALANLQTAPDPHAALLAELADIHLLMRAFQQLEDLPPSIQQEVLNQAGINFKKEAVLELNGTEDLWLCCAQNEGSRDESLFWRRTWLYGEQSKQFALLLDFAHGQSPYPDAPRPGQTFRSEVVYFPGTYPQRALMKNIEFVDHPFHLAADPDLETLARRFAESLAANPWNNLLPGWLDAVVPVYQKSQLFLVDRHQCAVPTQSSEAAALRLFALAGGRPLRVFGEWNGHHFTLLTAFDPDYERLVHLRDHTPLPRPSRGYGNW